MPPSGLSCHSGPSIQKGVKAERATYTQKVDSSRIQTSAPPVGELHPVNPLHGQHPAAGGRPNNVRRAHPGHVAIQLLRAQHVADEWWCLLVTTTATIDRQQVLPKRSCQATTGWFNGSQVSDAFAAWCQREFCSLRWPLKKRPITTVSQPFT